MKIKETLVTKFPRTMKLSEFITLESGLRPKGGVGGILEGIPSLGGEHLNADGGFIFQKIKYIPEDFFEALNKGHIYPNDIIVVKDGATTGKTSFVGNNFPHKRAVVNEHLFIMRVDPKVAFPKFVFYYLFSSNGQKQMLSDFRGATVGGISRYFPQKVDVPIPSMPEQTQIANFLDRKTEQIDELIRIKERRIELLQAQRTALINQAVTKGLDPNVEMKPSGVEWIAEIPRHWTLTRLKYVSSIPVTYGLNIEADRYTTEGIRLIRITDIDESGGLRQKGVYLSEDCVPQEQMLNSYDLLLSRSGATVGKSYLHLEKGKYTSAGYLVRFNFDDYWTSKFIYYVTLSHFYRNWLEQQIIISTIQNVNGEKYSNFQLPIPLYQEHKQIVDFLDRKTEQIDELIAAEQRKIELLKEYRQSLISETVTGKIDVRNEV